MIILHVIYLWQLCHASLPTRENLLFRGLDIDLLCPHSRGEIEDAEPLFLGCHNAQLVWQLASEHNWVDAILSTKPQTKIQNWLSSLRHSNPPIETDRIVTLLWSI